MAQVEKEEPTCSQCGHLLKDHGVNSKKSTDLEVVYVCCYGDCKCVFTQMEVLI